MDRCIGPLVRPVVVVVVDISTSVFILGPFCVLLFVEEDSFVCADGVGV